MKEEKGENNRFFRYSKKFVFGLKDLILVVSLTTNWILCQWIIHSGLHGFTLPIKYLQGYL